MDIMITDQTNTEDRVSFEMVSGKKEAYISFNWKLGMVSVLCKNASHRAWKGMGRTFWSWTEAKDAYKSSDMKSMIEYAEENSTPKLNVVG